MFWLLGQCPADAQSRSPNDVLSKDFALVRSGRVWITVTEQRLLDRLAALPKLRARVVDAEVTLSQIAEANAAFWRQSRAVQLTIEQLERSRRSAANGARRKEIDEELRRQRKLARRLQGQAVEPAELGGVPSVRERLIAVSNHRNALLLSLLWIRATVAELAEQYRILAADPRVANALRDLNGDDQLGPLRDYDQRLEQLGEYDKLVFTSHLPLYRTGDLSRVSLIISDQAPATFTWRDSHEPTILTASSAEAAGVSVPPTAPQLRLPVAGGRKVDVRRITIPYLRFGRYVVRDVPALLLPPEGEDLGSQVGPVALFGYQVVAEPERLRLTIKPAATP
jgi:hypothetical protein